MTEQEYKENLTRMFDSVRDNNKGARNCGGVNCHDCPLFTKVCTGDAAPIFYIYEAYDVVEEWAKQHPIETNADKFREVFGTKPSLYTCVNDINCEDCKYYGDVCYVRDLF